MFRAVSDESVGDEGAFNEDGDGDFDSDDFTNCEFFDEVEDSEDEDEDFDNAFETRLWYRWAKELIIDRRK